MLQYFHIHAGFACLIAIVLAFSSGAASAAGKTQIDYASDGKVVAAACLAFLEGKPPTAAINRSGFKTRKNNKRGFTFQKIQKGKLLPNYIIFGLIRKPGDPSVRKCTFGLALPQRMMTETSSPEFYDFMNALQARFKSSGYKRQTVRNRFGREQVVWTGRNGAYKLDVSTQVPVVFIEVAPK